MEVNYQGYFERICENFKDEAIIDLNIGYAHFLWPFIVIPVTALSLNIFIILTTIRKQISNRKRKVISIEKMLYYLTIVETLFSLYWLCNGIFFYKVKAIQDNCEACFASSILSIFIQTFDWVFFSCSLHNIQCFVKDPMKEQKFDSRLKIYFLISAGISGIFTYSVFFSEIYGVSPMLTCFIKNDFNNPHQDTAVYALLAIPLCYVIYSFYAFVKIFQKRKVRTDKDFKIAIIKYLMYSILYILFYFPTIILYIVSINQRISPGTSLSSFSYYCTLSTISINLVLSLFRIFEGYVKCDWKVLFIKQGLEESILSNDTSSEYGNDARKYSQTSAEAKDSSINFRPRKQSLWKKVESDMIKGFMKNIFIGLISAFDNTRSLEIKKTNKNKEFNEESKYIYSTDINEQKNKKADVTYVDTTYLSFTKNNNNDEEVYIEVSEYAPRIFKKIRMLENLTEDEIIESLNPLNNTKIIQSQGKSKSFFISTDDSKLVLKTLKKEEFDVVFQKFLIFYLHHLDHHPNSLICRIYGIFSIKTSKESDPILLIVMRNSLIGPLKKLITRTFDLKGSVQNREIFPDETNCNDPFLTRKDLNFLNDEKHLSILNKEQFVHNAIKDAEFFEDLNLMDYSLLIFKIEFKDKSLCELSDILDSKEYNYYKKHIFPSTENNNVIYVCSIIDYLQDYNFFKKMESNFKNYIIERPEKIDLISCVPADVYASRFIKFIQKITE